jgi:uncharacterized protein YerC
MTHVSRWKLPKEEEKNLIDALRLVLTRLTKDEEMEAFLDSLLTETEKIMLAKRLALVVLLEEGLTESQIAEALHVTRITVSKMHYFFESRGHGYKLALKKLAEQKMLDEFKKLLFSFLAYAAKASSGRI